MSDAEVDLTEWPLDDLNQLALAAFDGVAGVEIVDELAADALPEHGVNDQADKL